MEPNTRTMLLAGGMIFCFLFAAMTVAVAVQYGVDVFTFAAGVILVFLLLPLIGALRNPPED